MMEQDAAPAGVVRKPRTRAAPGAPPRGHYGPLRGARSWRSARPAGGNSGTPRVRAESAARRRKENAAMARRKAPRPGDRVRTQGRLRLTARRPPRIIRGTEGDDGPPRGPAKNTGAGACRKFKPPRGAHALATNSVVIIREGGRSSKRDAVRDYWVPAFAGTTVGGGVTSPPARPARSGRSA